MAECKLNTCADQDIKKFKKRQELPHHSDDSCNEDKTELEFEDLRPRQKRRENPFLALVQHSSGLASDPDVNLGPAQDCPHARPIDLVQGKVDPKQKKGKKIRLWRRMSFAHETKLNSDNSRTAGTSTDPTETQPHASGSDKGDKEKQRNEAKPAEKSASRKQIFPPKRLRQVAAAGESNVSPEKGESTELNGASPAAACGAQLQTSDSSCIAPQGPAATTEGTSSIANAHPLLEDLAAADKEEHTCSICYDIMVRPHSVRPCGHKFCEACLCQLHVSTGQLKFSGDRWSKPETDVLVLCPICRGGIKKCELDKELDTAIRVTYLFRYNKRLQLLQSETRKVKGSRLPSYRQPLPAGLGVRGPAAPQRHRIWNPLGPPLLTCFNRFWDYGTTVALYLGFSLYLTHICAVIVSTGLVKLCFRVVGRSGLYLTPERGYGAFVQLYVSGLGVWLIGFTSKLLFALSWWEMLRLSLCVNSLATAGYILDGEASVSLYRVSRFAFVSP